MRLKALLKPLAHLSILFDITLDNRLNLPNGLIYPHNLRLSQILSRLVRHHLIPNPSSNTLPDIFNLLLNLLEWYILDISHQVINQNLRLSILILSYRREKFLCVESRYH